MTTEMQQIKIAYEDEGMSPSEIAEDQQRDLIGIKAALMQNSSKYRKDCGFEDPSEDGLNFSDDELRAVNRVIYETAQCAELSDGSVDYKTRLAAAIYIRDDKKGRKEAVRNMQGNTFNFLQLNEQLAVAREKMQGVMKKAMIA